MSIKTIPTSKSVSKFLDSIEPVERREDCFAIQNLMKSITGKMPVMWGDSIVGFGNYHYKYDSGHEGDFFRTGFSPRKAALTVYIMPGYQNYGKLLERLGKHKTGKSCLYIKKLSDIDMKILKELIRQGLSDLEKIYPSN